MKKLLPLLLIAALLLSGCGESAPVEETPTPTVEPAFTFSESNYPVVRGGAAMEPLGEALAAVMLGKSQQEASSLGSFGSTGAAYTALLNGECSLALGLEPELDLSDAETAEIAKDALVFIVSAANPVDELTVSQLRDIYSGAATNWKTLGGNDVPVTAFQTNAASGTLAALKRLVMDGTPLAEPPMDHFPAENGEDGFIEAVAGFDGSAGAIGCTTYYYAHTMGIAEEYKLLRVDGTAPGSDTIISGEYPLTVSYQAAILSSAAERSPERLLWEWLQCDAGQSLVSFCGYCAARQGVTA